MQIRSSFSGLGQWAAFYQQGVPAILYRVRNKKCIFFTFVSPIQWAGRGHEQDAAWILEKVFDYDKRETPYALAFGAEARIPIEYGLKPHHSNNHVELDQALDELKEKRERAAIRMAEYQCRAAWQIEKLLRPRAFRKGELVLHRTFEEGKIQPNLEGPYVIADDGCKCPYKI